jgi:hypothetical protein
VPLLALKQEIELYPATNAVTASNAPSAKTALFSEIFRSDEEYNIVPPNPKKIMDNIPLSVAKKR